MHKNIFTLALLFCFAAHASAQTIIKADTAKTDSLIKKRNTYPHIIAVDVAYGMALPLADMRTTYTHALSLGMKLNYIAPSNWIFALSGDYLFAESIRIDVVSNLREANGLIIDQQGALTEVKEGLRGFMLQGSIGYIFPFNINKNRRFGIETRLNFGYFQHWVNIRFGGEDLLWLMGDYRQGYDRKTDGALIQPYIGIRYMANNRLANFFGGFDCAMAFTRNRRLWNYDQMRADNAPKFDVLAGFRLGIAIPFPIYNYRKETLEDVRYR